MPSQSSRRGYSRYARRRPETKLAATNAPEGKMGSTRFLWCTILYAGLSKCYRLNRTARSDYRRSAVVVYYSIPFAERLTTFASDRRRCGVVALSTARQSRQVRADFNSLPSWSLRRVAIRRSLTPTVVPEVALDVEVGMLPGCLLYRLREQWCSEGRSARRSAHGARPFSAHPRQGGAHR